MEHLNGQPNAKLRSIRVALIALIGIVALVGGMLVALPQLLPNDARLLFVGNSFTFNNELDQMTARLLEDMVPEWRRVHAERVAYPGYRLVEHRNDALQEGTPLETRLDEPWDLIVLQGQSQIAGFPVDRSLDKEALVRAARELHKHTRRTGAQTMLLMTWGYVGGDPQNSDIYGDYPAMQARLAEGYAYIAEDMTRTLGSPVVVIPAGLGFQHVYQNAPSTQYRQLYAPDGRHPGLAGTYLAACITAATYSGQPATNASWHPRGLDAEFAAYLRTVADAIVFPQ